EGFIDAIERGDSLNPPYDIDDNITAADNAPGVTTGHIVSLNVTGDAVGNSLNQVTVDYLDGRTNVSETAAGNGLDHLRAIGIDTDKDGRMETNVTDDVETSDFESENDGSKLVIELTGNYNLAAGDELIVVTEPAGTAGTIRVGRTDTAVVEYPSNYRYDASEPVVGAVYPTATMTADGPDPDALQVYAFPVSRLRRTV
ncbi:hypothetical protein BRD17_03120, partial [Halobacteriales archaeon SW_7_68_16]